MSRARDNELLVIAVILLQSLFIIYINNDILTSSNLSVLKGRIPYIDAGIIILSLLNIAAIKNVAKSTKYKTQAFLLKNHLDQVENLIIALQSQRHEYGRHLQIIQSLIELEKYEESKEYISGISSGHWRDEELYYIDHPAIASLVNSKRIAAQMQNIDFAVAVKCDLSQISVPAWDLCSILGNLLDNALEAAIQDDDPRVGVEFKLENGFYVMYIFNNGSSVSDPSRIFQAGYTTNLSEGRGYGLFIVKKLVDKYQGDIKIVTKQRTVTILRLPFQYEPAVG